MYLLLIVFGVACVLWFFMALKLDKQKVNSDREEYSPLKAWVFSSTIVFVVWQAARLISPFTGDIIGCIVIAAYIVIFLILLASRDAYGDDGLAILGIGLLFGFPTVAIILILARVFLV